MSDPLPWVVANSPAEEWRSYCFLRSLVHVRNAHFSYALLQAVYPTYNPTCLEKIRQEPSIQAGLLMERGTSPLL
jgi:hypothetical protein